MNDNRKTAGLNPWPVRWISGALILGLLLLAAFIWNPFGNSQAENQTPVFEVERGPLTISVTEGGTILALEQEVLKSEVEGQTTIIYLVNEGAEVQKGDLLVELDASKLVDGKVDQEIRVQNAEASFIQARENLEVVRNQAQSDIDKAELAYEFAQLDLKKFLEGEFPNDLKAAQSKISLASEELQRAEEKLKWSRVLYDEKYLSQSELQADELAANKAKLDLELEENNLELLKEYTYTRELASLESDVQQTEMALERIRRKANADVVQAEANLRAKESEYRRQQEKLEKIEDQITKTRITAPKDGMVVYATSGQGSWRGNEEPLDEGQQVRERQELIHLPTTNSFKANVKVHESSLDKISLGLPVRITVDALPGKVFEGKVMKIAPLPDAQSIFMNPDLKVYDTEIHILDESAELRTGMSCQAEIIVDRYQDVLYVPIQSVVRIGSEHYVYVLEGGGIERRPVKTGMDNNRMAHILSGVQQGEKVLLAPPLSPEAAGPLQQESADKGPPKEGDIKEPDTPAVQPEEVSPGNMTEEQRRKMRERLKNMSPEEREKLRRKFQAGGGKARAGGSGQQAEQS